MELDEHAASFWARKGEKGREKKSEKEKKGEART